MINTREFIMQQSGSVDNLENAYEMDTLINVTN